MAGLASQRRPRKRERGGRGWSGREKSGERRGIGLDLARKRRVREFSRTFRREKGNTHNSEENRGGGGNSRKHDGDLGENSKDYAKNFHAFFESLGMSQPPSGKLCFNICAVDSKEEQESPRRCSLCALLNSILGHPSSLHLLVPISSSFIRQSCR